MEYKEVIGLLDRIEQSLKSLGSETPDNNIGEPMSEIKTESRTIKEALLSKLTEITDTGTVLTNDRRDAEELAKKGVNVKLAKEANGEGVQFTAEETGRIAQETGKALANALRESGDEIDGMRAFRIEAGSFDIVVDFKKGGTDEFSFFIDNNKLVLVGFDRKTELGEVGTKPSGEHLLNGFILKNAFQKVFRSLNEEEFEKIKVDTNAPATTGSGERLYIGDVISIGSQEKGNKYFEIQYNPHGGIVMLQPVRDPNSLDPIGPPVMGGNPLFHKILISSRLISQPQPADVREGSKLSKVREEYNSVLETMKQSAKNFAQAKKEGRSKIFAEFRTHKESKDKLRNELIEELKESLISQLAQANEKDKISIRRKLKSSMWNDDDIDKALAKYNEKGKKPVDSTYTNPDHYDNRDKAQDAPKWNAVKYKNWVKGVAGDGGAQNAYDMAQNAKLERGLIDYVKKNIFAYGGDETPLERIQWDIEAYS